MTRQTPAQPDLWHPCRGKRSDEADARPLLDSGSLPREAQRRGRCSADLDRHDETRREAEPITMDGAAGVAQRRHPSSRAPGDDLGADRDRRLLRRSGADVEPDRRHQPVESARVGRRPPRPGAACACRGSCGCPSRRCSRPRCRARRAPPARRTSGRGSGCTPRRAGRAWRRARRTPAPATTTITSSAIGNRRRVANTSRASHTVTR